MIKYEPQDLEQIKSQLQSIFANSLGINSHWISKNELALNHTEQLQKVLSDTLKMTFASLCQHLESQGCSVTAQANQIKQEHGSGKSYRITFPFKSRAEETNILRQLMQRNIKFQDNRNNGEVSIQLNLLKPGNEMLSVELENEFRQQILSAYKQNSDQTNDFIYQLMFKILSSRDSKKLNPCQILQLLTQLRDRMFDNQKNIQQCIDQFKEKIRNFEIGQENIEMVDEEQKKNREESFD